MRRITFDLDVLRSFVTGLELGSFAKAADRLGRSVVFDAPCLMRSAATTALDRAGIPWRIAFTSPSLSGIWAAVAAGLGVTVRTEIGLPDNLRILDPDVATLPPLPMVGLTLHRAEVELDATTQRLREIILHTLEQPTHQFIVLHQQTGPSAHFGL